MASRCIGKTALDPETLKKDLKGREKFGEGTCGMGERAVYLPGIFSYAKYYFCYEDADRVFERLAVAEGGITGGGLSGAVPYVVVLFRDGTERQFLIRREGDLDALLKRLSEKHPEIRTVSAAAEQRMAAAQAKFDAEAAPHELTETEKKSIRTLELAKQRLGERSVLYQTLAGTASAKKTAGRLDARLQWVSVAILAGSILMALSGTFLLTKGGSGQTAVILLMVGIFIALLSLTSHTLPFGRGNRRKTDASWRKAVSDMDAFLKSGLFARARLKAGDAANAERAFPVPAPYAHPLLLDWMIRVLREGRTADGTIQEALDVTREDMRALNSNVTVSQEDYPRVLIIKPLFIANDYR
ncbi:MAG: hypothetical protein LKJ76_04155 [Lachnospiraceae bacterium]|jgi:hypothetical protein|nr:hypothetical protein [Lachnospiraceae bacterium]